MPLIPRSRLAPCLPCRYAAYGGVYTVLEVLALPAVPLTMTAGLLFGVPAGTAVVSVSSTAAATISFLIARYAGAPLAPLWLFAALFHGSFSLDRLACPLLQW